MATDLEPLLPKEYAAPVGVFLGVANIGLRKVTKSAMFQKHRETFDPDPYERGGYRDYGNEEGDGW
jgi:hypothetical protein